MLSSCPSCFTQLGDEIKAAFIAAIGSSVTKVLCLLPVSHSLRQLYDTSAACSCLLCCRMQPAGGMQSSWSRRKLVRSAVMCRWCVACC